MVQFPRFTIEPDPEEPERRESRVERPSTLSLIVALGSFWVARALRKPSMASRRSPVGSAIFFTDDELARARRFLYVAAFAPEYFAIRRKSSKRRASDRWDFSTSDKSHEWLKRNLDARKQIRKSIRSQGGGIEEALGRLPNDIWAPGPYDAPLWRLRRLPKGMGRSRLISIPHPGLRAAHQWIIRMLRAHSEPSQYSFGMERGAGSAIENAILHANASEAVSFDLEDCFDRITFDQVYRVFKRIGSGDPIVEIKKGTRSRIRGWGGLIPYGKYYIDDGAAALLASLVTRGRRLPQGAPTSPILANRVLRQLDDAIIRKLGDRGLGMLRYSRYFDDITISMTKRGQRDGRFKGSDFSRICGSIVSQECDRMGFRVNASKSRHARASEGITITGALVRDGKVGLPKSHRRRMRATCHRVSKSGIASIAANEKGLSYKWGEIRAIRNRLSLLSCHETPKEWNSVLRRAHAHLSAATFFSAGRQYRNNFPKDQLEIDYAELVHDSGYEIPSPASYESLGRSVRRYLDQVPKDWLRVRVMIEGGKEEVKVLDRFGDAAWKTLEIAGLDSEDPEAFLISCDETSLLIGGTSDESSIKVGVWDSTGIVPALLATPADQRPLVVRGTRVLLGHLSNALRVPVDKRSSTTQETIDAVTATLVDGWESLRPKPRTYGQEHQSELTVDAMTFAQQEAKAAEDRAKKRQNKAWQYWKCLVPEGQPASIDTDIQLMLRPNTSIKDWLAIVARIMRIVESGSPLPSRMWPTSSSMNSDLETPISLASFALELSRGERQGNYIGKGLEFLGDPKARDWEGFRRNLVIASSRQAGQDLAKLPCSQSGRIKASVTNFARAHGRLTQAGLVVASHGTDLATEMLEQMRDRQTHKTGIYQLSEVARLLNEWTITKLVKDIDSPPRSFDEKRIAQAEAEKKFLAPLKGIRVLKSYWSADGLLRNLRNVAAHKSETIEKYLNEHGSDDLEELRRKALLAIGRRDQDAGLPRGNALDPSAGLFDDLLTDYEHGELVIQLVAMAGASMSVIADQVPSRP